MGNPEVILSSREQGKALIDLDLGYVLRIDPHKRRRVYKP
jgi:hypothetical protein